MFVYAFCYNNKQYESTPKYTVIHASSVGRIDLSTFRTRFENVQAFKFGSRHVDSATVRLSKWFQNGKHQLRAFETDLMIICDIQTVPVICRAMMLHFPNGPNDELLQ